MRICTKQQSCKEDREMDGSESEREGGRGVIMKDIFLFYICLGVR